MKNRKNNIGKTIFVMIIILAALGFIAIMIKTAMSGALINF